MNFPFRRTISASLSPNTEADDVILALKILFFPWKWKKGTSLAKVELWFRRYFPGYEVELFNSGRSAMLALLEAFEIGAGDEVLVQAFTCVAVPNSVIWAGAKPVYVDIDKTLNMDPQEAEKHITPKTKAIIVQHTFGIPAQTEKLATFARKHHLILIEDCAHSLGAFYLGRKVGTYGDAAFFSFGRDKVVSSVFGGAAIINAKLQMPNAKLKQYQRQLHYPSHFWIFQQLLHPVAFSVILTSYNILIGKILLVALQKLRLLSFPVYPMEKSGRRPADFPARFPNALAILLVKQLGKLERFNRNRRETADFYRAVLGSKKIKLLPGIAGSINLRFPVLQDNSGEMLEKAKEQGILLGNWYHNIIDPTGVDFMKAAYRLGSCPEAERASRKVINLPTRITLTAAKRVADLF